MKLADDALLGIMACVRKGLVEGVDISDLLRKMELVLTAENKLSLDPSNDLWKNDVSSGDVWGS
mgnify:CR=1 FL=1